MAPRGNKHAVTHGGNAAPPADRVKEIADELMAALPVQNLADRWAVWNCALTLARVEKVAAWVTEHGPLDGNGRPRKAADTEQRMIARANKQLATLGLTPHSRARLGLKLVKAVDMANALSEPNDTKRAELMREVGLGD